MANGEDQQKKKGENDQLQESDIKFSHRVHAGIPQNKRLAICLLHQSTNILDTSETHMFMNYL